MQNLDQRYSYSCYGKDQTSIKKHLSQLRVVLKTIGYLAVSKVLQSVALGMHYGLKFARIPES